MTTMERLVEAYLEKERVINEQAQEIINLTAEVKKIHNRWLDLFEEKRSIEEDRDFYKEYVKKTLSHGGTSGEDNEAMINHLLKDGVEVVSIKDRRKDERFKSRLLGYQTPEYRRFTDPPAPLKIDPDKAKEIDEKLKETLG